VIVVKGALEAVLELCGGVQLGGEVQPMDEMTRAAILQAAEGMAGKALRVLAVAIVHNRMLEPSRGYAPLEGQANFVGLVGQLDPPRDEVREAVADCRAAGIRPVMVTGDYKATGMAIAQALGIARSGDLALDGRELEALSDAQLERDLDRVAVFARVQPAQKLRIVEVFQRRKEVVAMTGDGVNDAPALAKADVGIAMGITGTDVAKEAARIVITDDNFATIVTAVEQGRLVYSNVRKVLLYLFSTSVAELIVLLTALISGLPLPLAAVQILWINLVTDGVVTVNLIMEPLEGDEMQRPPTRTGERLLSRKIFRRLALLTPAMAISTLGYFVFRLQSGAPFAQVQTETFTMLAVCQWFNVLNCRSEEHSALTWSLFRNPWLVGGLTLGMVLQALVIFAPPLNALFHTVPIPWENAFLIGVVASLVLWVEEIRKALLRRRKRRSAGVEARPYPGDAVNV